MEHIKQGPFGEKSPAPVFDPIKAKEEIRQGLKDNLPEIRHELGKSDKESPLSFVFQASLEDGLDLARELRLSPEEIQKLTLKGGMWAYEKHDKVFKAALIKARGIGLPTDETLSFTGSHHPEFLKLDLNDIDAERKKFSPEKEQLMQKLENYYSEFLPYRLESQGSKKRRNEGGESIPQKFSDIELSNRRKAEHMRRAEGIIFDKYVRELSDIEWPDDISARAKKLSDLGIPENEHEDILRLVRKYNAHAGQTKAEAEKIKSSGAKAGDEVFPLIVMNAGGVKREWNLAKDRKPVRKIIEQMVKKEIVGDVQKMLNENSAGGYVVEKDSVTGQYVPMREAENRKRHEIEQARMDTEKAWNAVSSFLIDQKNPASPSVADISSWIEDITETEEWKKFEKNLGPEGDLPLTIQLSLAEKIPNPYLRKHIENYYIRDAVEKKHLRGIPQLLIDMSEGKQSTTLSPDEIGALYAYYEDNANCKNVATLSYEKQIEADKMLEAVNTLEDPNLRKLAKYFTPKSKEEIKNQKKDEEKNLKGWVAERLKSLNFIRQAMSEKLSALLRTVSAKPDTNIDLLAEKLVKACYPREWRQYQELQERSRSRSEMAGAFSGGGNRGGEGFGASEGGLTQDHFESNLGGGNYGSKEFQEGVPQKLATFDTPVSGMFVTNILGYDPVAGTWKRNYVPVDGDLSQDRSMKKVTAKVDSKIGRIIPAPIAAQKIALEGGAKSEVSQDSLGLIHLEGSRDISGWSYDIPSGTVVPGKIDENTYTRFLSRFVNEGGAGYLEKNPDLPVECKMFVESIKTLSPRDRVIKIQEFVTNKSFYDAYDNPIRDKMNSAPFSERCALMKERLEMLQDELGDQVPQGLMFAGVCADFAMVTESMFREAGIASAVIEGYNMSGTEMTSHNAHGKSGVFWPDANGKTILAEIETTPPALTKAQSGAYAMQGIAPEPLTLEIEKAHLEEEKQAEEIAQEIEIIESGLQETLKKFEGTAEQKIQISPEERKRMEEQVLALRAKIAEYVQQTATLEDIAILKGVLDAIRFSPVTKMDQQDVEGKVAGMQFIQSEYGRLQKDYENREEPLERISHLGKNFIGDLDAMVYNSHVQGEDRGFIEYVGQVGEYGAKKLPENHAKIWSMLKTYMRAKLL